MLVYSGSKKNFDDDIRSGCIADVIKRSLYDHGIYDDNESEYTAWENSLVKMQEVLDEKQFSGDLQVAVEYEIPQTSKRVDFLIAGEDDNSKKNVVVVELKQWEEAHHTENNGIVSAFTGGMMRSVAHPSYQAYSYAKTIENFCATVQDEHISLFPCAYLHNYKTSRRSELTYPIYSEILDESPIFIKNEEEKLRRFISKYVKKGTKEDLLLSIDHGKIRPSKALQDVLVNMIKGSDEFVLIDEQKVAYEIIKEKVKDALAGHGKYTIVVEGGPGTGKSVVAIRLLTELVSNMKLNACYATKNSAPRNVYFDKLKQGKFKLNYVKNLFKSTGIFIDSEPGDFDCILVDEAHRLNEKSGVFSNKGENQIKEIINAAKVSVFFLDEDQIVTAKDIGSMEEIKKWAARGGSRVIAGDDLHLTSQFRCNGSTGYIAFLDDLLGIRKTANAREFDMDFDIRVFDDPLEMRETLRGMNSINNKARMVAGYCYDWITKKSNDFTVYDIELPGGFKAQWNFSNTNTWAIDNDSFNQVGCIHTSQGLEFDYVGVIIGRDLRYESGKVITDFRKRSKDDKSLNGLKGDKSQEAAAKMDRIIRNTYRTLMTRGQKGCYIYCEDEELSRYMKKRISQRKNEIENTGYDNHAGQILKVADRN